MRKSLLYFARSPFADFFIGFIFEHLSFLIPLNKVYSNQKVVVYKHPLPVSKLHFLIVPKKAICSFQKADLERKEITGFIISMFSTAKYIIKKHLKETGTNFSVVINGGKYQEVNQLHMHIIRDNENIQDLIFQTGNNRGSKEVLERSKKYLIIKDEIIHNQQGYIFLFKNIEVKSFLDLNIKQYKKIIIQDLCILQNYLKDKNVLDFSLIFSNNLIKNNEVFCVGLLQDK